MRIRTVHRLLLWCSSRCCNEVVFVFRSCVIFNSTERNLPDEKRAFGAPYRGYTSPNPARSDGAFTKPTPRALRNPLCDWRRRDGRGDLVVISRWVWVCYRQRFLLYSLSRFRRSALEHFAQCVSCIGKGTCAGVGSSRPMKKRVGSAIIAV